MLNQIEEKFTKVFIRALRMWVLVGNGPLDDTFAEVTKGIWNTIGAGIVKRNEGPIEVLSGTYTISDGANDYVVNYRSSVNFMHDYLVLPRQSYTKTHTITHTIIGIKFHIRKIGKSVGSKIERTEFQLVPGGLLEHLTKR